MITSSFTAMRITMPLTLSGNRRMTSRFRCRTSRGTRSRASMVAWMVIGVFACSALGLCHWLTKPDLDNSEQTDFVRRHQGGTLVIAGGGPLPAEIRSRFLDFAGGPQQARLVVIPAYDLKPQQSVALLQAWHDLGVKSVQILHAKSRGESNQAEFVRPIELATGVWLTGGAQEWLSKHYAGTLVEKSLQG